MTNEEVAKLTPQQMDREVKKLVVNIIEAVGVENNLGMVVAGAIVEGWRRSQELVDPEELKRYDVAVRATMHLLGLDEKIPIEAAKKTLAMRG